MASSTFVSVLALVALFGCSQVLGAGHISAFCSDYGTTCKFAAGFDATDKYLNQTECMDFMETLVEGTPDQTSTNTAFCRIYHMSIAKTSAKNAEIHCKHTGPTGGGVCSGAPNATDFCSQYKKTCGFKSGDSSSYEDMSKCESSYNAFVEGTMDQKSTDTKACRVYHLGAGDPGIHCPHAGKDGGNVCSANPSAEDFCNDYLATCKGDLNGYGSLDACKTAYAAYAAGTMGATSGDTAACRVYHLGAAHSDPTLHCPHASPNGGVCGALTTPGPTTETEAATTVSSTNSASAMQVSVAALTMTFVAMYF